MMVDINTNQNDGGLNEVPVKFGYEAKQISSTDVPPDAMTQLLLAGSSNSQDIGSPHGDNTSFQTYNQTKTQQCPFILHPCTDGSLPIDLNPSNMVQGSLGPTAVQPVHPKMAAFPNSFMYTAQHNGGHNCTKMIYPADNNLHIPAILSSEEMMPNAMEQGSHRPISAQPGGAGMAVLAQGFMNTSQHIENLYSTNCFLSNSFGSIFDVPMTGQLNPSTMEQGRYNLVTNFPINYAHPNIPEVSRPGEMNPSTLEHSSLGYILSQPDGAGMVVFPDDFTSIAQNIGGGSSSMMYSLGGDDHNHDASLPSGDVEWNDILEVARGTNYPS